MGNATDTSGMTTELIDVPRGLNGVAVADTSVGDVLGDEGRYHYRGYDAVELARRRRFEDVWALMLEGELPVGDDADRFRERVGTHRRVPDGLGPVIDAIAATPAAPLAALRAVLSASVTPLGLEPLVDSPPQRRLEQALRLAAAVPAIVAALHRARQGLTPVAPDPSLDHASAYLHLVTGQTPDPVFARALEQYLTLTIDHGFNASTFTARVVASTGADLADVVGAALGALAGPLHGGAPSRALDALDAIGAPDHAEAWVTAEVAAGRRIMGFGHAVYRRIDPRSALLRRLALDVGGELAVRAVEVEGRIETTLDRLKPGRPLATNVEYYAGVVMAACGLPRELFTPTFAVSRVVGWCAHALEQAAEPKLIRPASRYAGPGPFRQVPPGPIDGHR
jgi:citrate synthase